MTRTYGIKQARPKLGDLITEMQQSGEGIVLTRNGRPVARLIPYVEEPVNVTVPDWADYIVDAGKENAAALEEAGRHLGGLRIVDLGDGRTALDEEAVAELRRQPAHADGLITEEAEGVLSMWIGGVDFDVESAATVAVNVIDGRIMVTVAGGEDTDIHHRNGRVLPLLAEVEPWGAEETGMERADVELARMGWRRTSGWADDGDGWRADVKPASV